MVTKTRIATDIELVVISWLDKNNINYQFQSIFLGGFYQLGGAVVDFILSDKNIALRVMGEYWHRGVVPEGRDIIQREMLTSLGFIVVDLWSTDLEDNLEETMRKAILGEEMLR
jgi:very-short-patch-repair endonuclease